MTGITDRYIEQWMEGCTDWQTDRPKEYNKGLKTQKLLALAWQNLFGNSLIYYACVFNEFLATKYFQLERTSAMRMIINNHFND